MMVADWDMTPLKGGSGNAFAGRFEQERVFIKKNGSPFLTSIYLEGITPKVLWTKRTAQGDTLSAQPWIDGHTLTPAEMDDTQINQILSHLHHSHKLVDSCKKLGNQVVRPRDLLTKLLHDNAMVGSSHYLSGLIEQMQEDLPELAENEAVVVHGDVNHRNWLVDDENGRVYLVDWDTVFLSDPMVDVAYILSHYIEPADWSRWLTYSGYLPREKVMKKVAWYGKYSFLRQISDYLKQGRLREANEEILQLRHFCELF